MCESEGHVEDRDLVIRTLAGDERAYRQLIGRYRNAVFGLAVSFVRDFDLAEDLAQEAFILGYYRLSTLTDGDRFGVWLRTITANLCRMELRRQRVTPVESFDADATPGSGPAPDEVHMRNEIQGRVLAALGGLSEKDREAVALYYLDERSIAEIGRFLGVTAGAVKGRLHRARGHLRREMVDMAKKTLSQKQLGPEFAEKVYLRTFSDLAQLTDEELGVLVHHFEQDTTDMSMSLVYALHRDDPETKALQERILKILPERQREFFRLRLKYSDPVRHFRGKVLTVVYDLQEKGLIRPRPGAPDRKSPEGTVEIEQFSDIARMTDEEFWWVLCKVDTVDLAAALMSEEPGVEKVRARCYDNVSERVRSFLEFPLNVAEERVRACQEGILKIVHQMQEAGEIRAGKKG